jgi:hypothetical protein
MRIRNRNTQEESSSFSYSSFMMDSLRFIMKIPGNVTSYVANHPLQAFSIAALLINASQLPRVGAQAIPTDNLVLNINGTYDPTIHLNNVFPDLDQLNEFNGYRLLGDNTSYINVTNDDNYPVDYQTMLFFFKGDMSHGNILTYNNGGFSVDFNPRHLNPNYSNPLLPYGCGTGLMSVLDDGIQSCGISSTPGPGFTHFGISIHYPLSSVWYFINGTQVDATSFTYSQTAPTPGQGYILGSGLNGTIANVLLYSQPLTNDQISAIYADLVTPPYLASSSSSSGFGFGTGFSFSTPISGDQGIPTDNLVLNLNGTSDPSIHLNNVVMAPDQFNLMNGYRLSGNNNSYINVTSNGTYPVDYQTFLFFFKGDYRGGNLLTYSNGDFSVDFNPRHLNPNYTSLTLPYGCGTSLLSVVDDLDQSCGISATPGYGFTHFAISLHYPLSAVWYFINGTQVDATRFTYSQQPAQPGQGYFLGSGLNGTLSNVLLYSQPLTNDQIAAIYSEQTTPPFVLPGVSSSSSGVSPLASSSARSSSSNSVSSSRLPASSSLSSSTSIQLSSSPVASSSFATSSSNRGVSSSGIFSSSTGLSSSLRGMSSSLATSSSNQPASSSNLASSSRVASSSSVTSSLNLAASSSGLSSSSSLTSSLPLPVSSSTSASLPASSSVSSSNNVIAQSSSGFSSSPTSSSSLNVLSSSGLSSSNAIAQLSSHFSSSTTSSSTLNAVSSSGLTSSNAIGQSSSRFSSSVASSSVTNALTSSGAATSSNAVTSNRGISSSGSSPVLAFSSSTGSANTRANPAASSSSTSSSIALPIASSTALLTNVFSAGSSSTGLDAPTASSSSGNTVITPQGSNDQSSSSISKAGLGSAIAFPTAVLLLTCGGMSYCYYNRRNNQKPSPVVPPERFTNGHGPNPDGYIDSPETTASSVELPALSSSVSSGPSHLVVQDGPMTSSSLSRR